MANIVQVGKRVTGASAYDILHVRASKLLFSPRLQLKDFVNAVSLMYFILLELMHCVTINLRLSDKGRM